MKTVDLGDKLRDCCEAAKMTVDVFLGEYREEFPDHDPRTTENWLKWEGAHDMRGETPSEFISFWAKQDVRLEVRYLAYDRQAFRRSIGLTEAANIASVPDSWRSLAGVYQVIRPHAVSTDWYVCEAMEIEIEDNLVTTLFYSNDSPDEKYLYSGKAEPAERYYFSLLRRAHETIEGRLAFRSIAFYSGEGRYGGCLSGIMTKGLRGVSSGKELTALPFLALPMTGASTLRTLDRVKIKKAHNFAEQVYLLHRGQSIIVGDISRKAAPKIYKFILDIMAGEEMQRSIRKHEAGIYSVAPLTLKNIAPDLEIWVKLVASLPVVDE